MKIENVKDFKVEVKFNKINPSEEEIIHKAFEVHSKGNITEAKKYYEFCINNGYEDSRVYLNYGAILHNLGNLKDAELFYRKSIATTIFSKFKIK